MTVSSPDAPAAAAIVGSRTRWRRLRVWLFAGAGVAVASLAIVLAVLASSYQPLVFGGAAGGTLPGGPAAIGVRTVNTFGSAQGQMYIPPQGSRAFTVMESVRNAGSRAVTIEAVSLLSPSQQSDGASAWPLVAAGPTRWRYEIQPPVGSGSDVRGFRLQPGRDINVGMVVRQANPCYEANGWTAIDSFWVKERFGPFTHWVHLPMGEPLIMKEPEPANTGGATCPGNSG